MKLILIALFLFSAAAAHAQSSGHGMIYIPPTTSDEPTIIYRSPIVPGIDHYQANDGTWANAYDLTPRGVIQPMQPYQPGDYLKQQQQPSSDYNGWYSLGQALREMTE